MENSSGNCRLGIHNALRNCYVETIEGQLAIRDLSFSRIILDQTPLSVPLSEFQPFEAEIILDKIRFKTSLVLQFQKDDWARLTYHQLSPSHQALLRSFLTARRIGESLAEDWRSEDLIHFHGINEAELWWDKNTGLFLTFLDSVAGDQQFVLRVSMQGEEVQAGSISRADYLSLSSLNSPLPIQKEKVELNQFEACKDIITNFRPASADQAQIKQVLLKAISDCFYQRKYLPIKMERKESCPVTLHS